jgi:hypothetical protein
MVESLALAAGLVALAHTGAGMIRLGGQIRSGMASANTVPIGAPLPATGVDIWGKLFVPETLDPGQDSVAFVLHASTCRADLAYWNSVFRAVRGRRNLRFLAFCDGHACADAARRAQSPNVTVLAYGQVLSLERLWRSDTRGVALIVDYVGQMKGAVPWRGVATALTVSRLMEGR